MKERKPSLEKTERTNHFSSKPQCNKEKGRENLSIMSQRFRSKLNKLNVTNRGDRNGFALEKSAEIIASVVL